jgi:hypothetical protein
MDGWLGTTPRMKKGRERGGGKMPAQEAVCCGSGWDVGEEKRWMEGGGEDGVDGRRRGTTWWRR